MTLIGGVTMIHLACRTPPPDVSNNFLQTRVVIGSLSINKVQYQSDWQRFYQSWHTPFFQTPRHAPKQATGFATKWPFEDASKQLEARATRGRASARSDGRARRSCA